MPKVKKTFSIKPRRPFGLRAAFGAGKRAFSDPSMAVAPGAAFGGALPQGSPTPAPVMPGEGQ